jgi:hypothetical protein
MSWAHAEGKNIEGMAVKQDNRWRMVSLDELASSE